MMGTYLLHFDKETTYPNAYNYGDKTHYIGFSLDVDKRIKKQLNGRGSTMTRQAFKDGACIRVGFVFPMVNCEKQLMNAGFNKFCKYCNPHDYNISERETKMYADMKEGIFHEKKRMP